MEAEAGRLTVSFDIQEAAQLEHLRRLQVAALVGVQLRKEALKLWQMLRCILHVQWYTMHSLLIAEVASGGNQPIRCGHRRSAR